MLSAWVLGVLAGFRLYLYILSDEDSSNNAGIFNDVLPL